MGFWRVLGPRTEGIVILTGLGLGFGFRVCKGLGF